MAITTLTDQERAEIVEDLAELCEYRDGLLETPPIHQDRRDEMIERIDTSISRLRTLLQTTLEMG